MSKDRGKTTALKKPKPPDPPEPLESSETSEYTETILSIEICEKLEPAEISETCEPTATVVNQNDHFHTSGERKLASFGTIKDVKARGLVDTGAEQDYISSDLCLKNSI